MPDDLKALERNPTAWLEWLSSEFDGDGVDGLVPVHNFDRSTMRLEEVAIMEKAAHYGAQFVFFEAPRNNRAPVPQAFVYVADERTDNDFADLHRRLWNWGGVPLVYRKTDGLIRLFRCAHRPEFFDGDRLCYKPYKTFSQLADISQQLAWWDSSRLYNGTLWDDPEICREFLNAKKSAHRELVKAVKGLNTKLTESNLLDADLRRRLLILTLLVEYLEERGVLKPEYFAAHLAGAERFFDVLRNGCALVELFEKLKSWFNGDVFNLTEVEKATIQTSAELDAFAALVEGYEEPSGQINFWRLYSFDDLPVELISEIYQLFVEDQKTAVYTPPALVRLILEEVLNQDRMIRLLSQNEVVLDPACGSGVFLVEAYKRLILHWRSENRWKPPTPAKLKELAKFVHGVDVESSAIELTNFSLCLAMCDALKPRDIQESVQLFPELKDHSLHKSCFFEAKAAGKIQRDVGVIVGNPPFASVLKTKGAKQAASAIKDSFCPLPDKQVAYLFLQQAMEMLVKGGLLGMIQQCGFLYNKRSAAFRTKFFARWDVREVLDFVSVRGMFDRDTKVVVLLAEALKPRSSQKTLHVVFRRSGRADAEQSFDIDYYDMHWIGSDTLMAFPFIWRSNLLGGGRVHTFVQRLRGFPTLKEYAKQPGWNFGEGFIAGKKNISRPAAHLIGKPLLPTEALDAHGLDESKITTVPDIPIKDPKAKERFTPPYLLIKEHEDFHHFLWEGDYLTFKHRITALVAPKKDVDGLKMVNNWLSKESTVLKAFCAATSSSSFMQMATVILDDDIKALPFPLDGNLCISSSEKIISDDIVGYMRDFIRLGDKSDVLTRAGIPALPAFNATFLTSINGIYTDNQLMAHPCQSWPGIICQPYSFGPAIIDWSDVDALRGKLDVLLKEQKSESLSVTRIARVYDGNMLYLIKPDRLRFWLRSIALRDADEVLADLRAQGF